MSSIKSSELAEVHVMTHYERHTDSGNLDLSWVTCSAQLLIIGVVDSQAIRQYSVIILPLWFKLSPILPILWCILTQNDSYMGTHHTVKSKLLVYVTETVVW